MYTEWKTKRRLTLGISQPKKEKTGTTGPRIPEDKLRKGKRFQLLGFAAL